MKYKTHKFILLALLALVVSNYSHADDAVFVSESIFQGEIAEAQLSQTLTSCMQVQYQKILLKFFKAEPQCEKFTQLDSSLSLTKLHLNYLFFTEEHSDLYLTPVYSNPIGDVLQTSVVTNKYSPNGSNFFHEQYIKFQLSMRPPYADNDINKEYLSCLAPGAEASYYNFYLPLPSLKVDRVSETLSDFGKPKYSYVNPYFQYRIDWSEILEKFPLFNIDTQRSTRLFFNAREYMTCVKDALNPQTKL